MRKTRRYSKTQPPPTFDDLLERGKVAHSFPQDPDAGEKWRNRLRKQAWDRGRKAKTGRVMHRNDIHYVLLLDQD